MTAPVALSPSVPALRTEFGSAIGLAFQLADDLLDLSADPATMGKATGKDSAKGKATLAGLHGRMYKSPVLDELKLRSWAQWWKDMMDVTPAFGPE